MFIGFMSDRLHAFSQGLLWSIVCVAAFGFFAACLLMRTAGRGVAHARRRACVIPFLLPLPCHPARSHSRCVSNVGRWLLRSISPATSSTPLAS